MQKGSQVSRGGHKCREREIGDHPQQRDRNKQIVARTKRGTGTETRSQVAMETFS